MLKISGIEIVALLIKNGYEEQDNSINWTIQRRNLEECKTERR